MMEIKRIEYDIEPRDLMNNCLDVVITLEDNSSYLVEVTTLPFLKILMEENKFLPPGHPYIIVSELRREVIRAAIEEFIVAREDSYWLKLYHATATLNIKDVNRILHQKKIENLKLDMEIEAEILAESAQEFLNIFSNTKIILRSILFLIFGSFISYSFFKPELFDLFSNLIN